MLRSPRCCWFILALAALAGCDSSARPTSPTASNQTAVTAKTVAAEPADESTEPVEDSADGKPAQDENPPAGEAAVTLQVGDRAAFDALLKKQRGDVVLVDFWATWCAPCKKGFPHTVELYRKLHDQRLAVITVSCDGEDAHESALRFLQTQQADFANLRLAEGAAGDAFDSFDLPGGLPHYNLYDREGELRYQFSVDPAAAKQFTHKDIQQRVQELLAEKAE